MATIRLGRTEDAGQLVSLYGHLHLIDDPRAPEDIRAAWQRIQDQPDMYVVVAEVDDALIASCVLNVIPNLTRGCRPYACIENVVTHADYRRQGFGRQVIHKALEIAEEHRCFKVMLMTGRSDEGVHQFYKDCGFRADVKTAYLATPGDAS